MSLSNYKIPLFDIDWTLLAKDKKRNIHDEAFYCAFETVYGLKVTQKESVEGWIDNQIILETVIRHGISEKEAKRKLPQTTKVMAEYFLTHRKEGKYLLLPGVKEILISLQKKGILTGLLTGNVEEIAWGKIEEAGIKNFFQFGAFGNEVYKRVDLINLAHQRAEKLMRRKLLLKGLVIVGDTPLDVACAKEGGIESIAIASGPHPLEELSSAGADLVLKSLKEKDKIINFLKLS